PKDLSKIVLEMLVEGKEEKEIIDSLRSVGLNKKKAEDVYKKISKEYHGYLTERLEGEVEKIFKEQTDELLKRFEKKVKDTFEETQLKIDLNFSEIKREVNSRVQEPKQKADENRERIKQLRKDTERGYGQLRDNMERIENIGPLGAIIPATTILIGLFSVVYSLSLIPDHYEFIQDPLTIPPISIGLIIIGIIAGIILTAFGVITILKRGKIKENVFKKEE
ncbi:MAG: hypothetical protein ACOCTT_03150, partial [archaeon]